MLGALFGGQAQAGQLSASAFQPWSVVNVSSITPGPFSLYSVALSSLLPTQIDEGYTEVNQKTAAFNLQTPAQVQATLLGYVEPVVIGPNGQLYLTDGHHTFTALANSIYGPSDPTVYINIIANYSNLTTAQFFAQMEAVNLLLPLNDGVAVPVNTATGAPIPTSLTTMGSDVYRGLEYSILKNKSSTLFPTAANLTGAVGASTPGLDKMTGAYVDFIEAEAYRNANGGLGLPYLSPADIALSTQWNLNANSVTTIPNISPTNAIAGLTTLSGQVTAAQLPGFILSQNISNAGGISNATLANGAMDGNGTFTGLDYVNLGTAANPIMIGAPNIGFVMELGNDAGYSVTLNGANTYTGGTNIVAGNLIIASDASLGAAVPQGATIDPNHILASVEAANGIIFNSLTEGNGTLTIGTTTGGTFSTSRPIAVDGEVATINVNGNTVTLNGPLVSLGTAGVGIGNATGVADLTIDDLSAGTQGKLLLQTPSPYFYGNIIIGNTGTPTVEVMSDAALGNMTGTPASIGQIELNGGTLQVGAAINAPERDMFLGGGSNIDLNGYASTWGTLTDVQRTLDILNSSTTAVGAITFNNLSISATAILQLAGGIEGETVTFSNGINRTGNDTLILNPSSSTSLGLTEKVFSSGSSATLVNGMAPAWIVTNNGVTKGAGPYDFVTYGVNGYSKTAYTSTSTLPTSGGGSQVIALSGNATATGNVAAYALNTEGKTVALATHTLTIGDGVDPAGLILSTGTAISNGTLAFGSSEGVIWMSGSPTISAQITGSNGLTFSGSGGVTISTAANVSGPLTLDSGTLTLSAANVFSGDAAGLTMSNVKSKPAAATLTLTASNAFSQLNTVGNNSTINLSGGAALTLGDSNNFSSTVSAALKETGAATTGALTLDGSGLFDFSGAKFTLVSGSTIVVNNSAQLRVASIGTSAPTSTDAVVLNGTSQLQLAEKGGTILANPISGTGSLHLMSGTVQITGTGNTYSGGTNLETGSTLDITTANLPTVNANIANAGGTVVFDQATSGTYAGVISNGLEMGTGPLLAGSLIKDDSTGANSGNVTLTQVQTYTGQTSIEAGTLTLAAVDTLAASSGVVLGRVGGCVGTGCSTSPADATLALAANNTIQSLSSNAGNTSAVTLAANTLTIATAAANGGPLFAGVISGSGNVVISGNGVQNFSGTNTYTGGTTVNAGADLGIVSGGESGSGTLALNGSPTTMAVLSVAGDATTHTAAISNAITISNAAAINVSAGTTATVSSVIGNGTSAGQLSTQGSGVLTLTGVNTLTGTTTVGAGSYLALSGTGSVASSGAVVVNGNLDISQTSSGAAIKNLSGSGTVSLGSQNLTVQSGTSTFAGVLADGGIVNNVGGSLTIASGSTTLSGVNTYTGATTINSGATLALTGQGSIANSAGVLDNGTLTISGAASTVDLTDLSGHGVLNLGANSLQLSESSFSGSINGSGSLIITGASSVISGGNAMTGSTTIGSNSTLTVVGSGDFSSSSGLVDNGTLSIAGVTNGATFTTISGAGGIVTGNQNLTITAGSGNYAGTISGAGAVDITGGTEEFSGANLYSGGTVVSANAVLEITSGAALGSGTLALVGSANAPATLSILNTTTIANPITVAGDPVFIVAPGTTTTITSVIADGGTPGDVVVQGSGLLELTAANTYTGLTSVASGSHLALSGGGSIANSGSVAVNGTFDISQTVSGAVITDLSGSGLVSLGNQNLTIANGSSTFSGALADGGIALGTVGGSLTVAGGSATLTGTNTYTGSTTILPGATLALAGTGSIASSATVAADGTLDISGHSGSVAITDISGTGSVALGGQNLTITNGSSTFSGTVKDGGVNGGAGGALTVAGGVVTLAGVNTYTGMTQINAAATLALSGTGSVATSAAVVNNGTFDISNGASAVAVKALTQTGSGTLVMAVAPTTAQQLTVTGAAALNGNLLLNNQPGTYGYGHYDLITAASVTGQFANVALAAAVTSPISYSVSYGADDVILNISPNNGATLNSIAGIASGMASLNSLNLATLAGSLGNDCSSFGENQACLTVGASRVADSSGNLKSGDAILGLKINPAWRAGVFADQAAEASTIGGITQNNSRPLFGAFAGWNQNFNGTGLGLQAATDWSSAGLTIKRAASATSESGEGSTWMKGNAFQIKASYVIPVTGEVSVTPFAGVRYSQVRVAGYTETGAVYPVTYNGFTQRAIDGLVGASASYQFTAQLSGFISGDLTRNLEYSTGSVAGTSQIVGLQNFSVALPGSHYSSFGTGAGLGYDFGNNQRLNFGFSWQQPTLNKIKVNSESLSYTVGF